MNEENNQNQESNNRLLKKYGMDNQYETELIRGAMLTNGGAAIALLAFIGSIWSTGLDDESLRMLCASLHFFSWGVFFAFASLFFCYLRANDGAFLNKPETEQKWYKKIGNNWKIKGFWILIVMLLLASFALFMWGINFAIDTFCSHLSSAATGR